MTKQVAHFDDTQMPTTGGPLHGIRERDKGGLSATESSVPSLHWTRIGGGGEGAGLGGAPESPTSQPVKDEQSLRRLGAVRAPFIGEKMSWFYGED